MKLNYAIYSMLAFSMVAASCSQDEEMVNAPSAKSNITISVTDLGLTSADGTRATTDASYVTTFADGDAIGLYAVSNGTIVSTCNNLKLTKSGSSWTGLTSGSSFDSDTKFYAYYPYSESATFDATKGFESMISSWDPTTASSYDAGDLMTSEATSLTKVDDVTYSLSLALNHAMSMIEITAQSGSTTTYKFQNADVTLSDYTVAAGSSASSVSIKLGDTDITSNAEKVSGKYRVLVSPSTTSAISVGIGDDTYKSDALSLTAGNYYTITAGETSGSTEVEWTLEVGDIMLADGSLAKASSLTADQKSSAIGVVCYVGDPSPSQKYPASYGTSATTDKTSLDGLYQGGYSHGMVYSLTGKDFTSTAWGTTITNQLYTLFSGVTTQIAECSNSNIPKRAFLGYANMATLNEINGTNGYFDAMLSAINNFSVSAPSSTSGWFLPCIGDLTAMIKGSVTDGNKVTVTMDGSTIESSFTAAGATLWAENTVYMTSSPGIKAKATNTDKFFGIISDGTSGVYAVDGTESSTVVLRPMLAF